jgi:hypothetical protein
VLNYILSFYLLIGQERNWDSLPKSYKIRLARLGVLKGAESFLRGQ